MTRKRPPEQSEREPGKEYRLLLYVTGMTPKSIRAIENIRAICRKHLKARYTLKVIDLYQEPALAKRDQILAAPTLVKKLPAPLRRIIGDLSQSERVLVGLDLLPRSWSNERGPR